MASVNSKVAETTAMARTTATTTAEDVLLFVPNLIGYVRAAMTLSSFGLMLCGPRSYWLLAIGLYLSSFVGDLFDGMAARKFQQTSSVGALFDMVTDRCSTLGILYVLGLLSAQDAILRTTFLALILLDISSHWCQMHSTMMLSRQQEQAHHKSKATNEGRNILVQWYYQHYWFFGYLCVGAEFTYICLYIRQYAASDSIVAACNRLVLCACLPGCVLKQVVNVFQLSSACYAVASHDAQERNQQVKQR